MKGGQIARKQPSLFLQSFWPNLNFLHEFVQFHGAATVLSK